MLETILTYWGGCDQVVQGAMGAGFYRAGQLLTEENSKRVIQIAAQTGI